MKKLTIVSKASEFGSKADWMALRLESATPITIEQAREAQEADGYPVSKHGFQDATFFMNCENGVYVATWGAKE